MLPTSLSWMSRSIPNLEKSQDPHRPSSHMFRMSHMLRRLETTALKTSNFALIDTPCKIRVYGWAKFPSRCLEQSSTLSEEQFTAQYNAWLFVDHATTAESLWISMISRFAALVDATVILSANHLVSELLAKHPRSPQMSAEGFTGVQF